MLPSPPKSGQISGATMRNSALSGTIAISLALFGTSAVAADMPLKAPPPPVWNWTGFYAGVNGGYAFGTRGIAFSPNDPTAAFLTCGGGFGGGTCPPATSMDVKGGLGGLQLGYNWQPTPYALIGIETDFNWSGIKRAVASTFQWGGLPGGSPAAFAADQNIKWFGTLRGRLGWLPANNFLIYVTGGFAYGRVDESVGFTAGGNAVGVPPLVCSPLVAPAPVLRGRCHLSHRDRLDGRSRFRICSLAQHQHKGGVPLREPRRRRHRGSWGAEHRSFPAVNSVRGRL